jgi:hypothetical protein
MIARRFLWDLHPFSWMSRSRLKKARNIYAGTKAVVLCNGPSLLETDFSSLRDTFTFGLNKINLLFDKHSFRPSCVVSVNPLVIEQNRDFFNSTDIPLYISSVGAKHVSLRPTVTFIHPSSIVRFAKDCSVSVYEGYTVTFVALQLAFHMGFEEVAIVGADHTFAEKGPANKTVISGAQDSSHFDPNYFAGGVKWQLPDLFQSEVSYTLAKNMFEAHDRLVVNATVGGKLEVFPRMDLANFLAR